MKARARVAAQAGGPSAAPTPGAAPSEPVRHAELLRAAMDLEDMAAWTWDRQLDRVRVEYRAARAGFLRGGSPTMKSFLSRIHRADRPRVRAAVGTALEQEETQRVEFRLLGPGGQQQWISSAFRRYLDAAGRPAGLVGASRNITVRKDFYRELAQSEAQLRTVLETEPECVKILDAAGRLQMMNPAGLAMIEADAAREVVGQQALGLVATGHRAAFQAFHRRIMAGHTESLEFEIVGLKGTRRWMHSKAAPLRDAAGQIVGHLAVARDVTEQRALSARIIQAANREQERIGHDLHDGLGQELTGIALMLKGLQGRPDAQQAGLRRELQEIERLVSQALASTRSIARGLSPVALERGGLAEALRLLVAQTREAASPRLRLSIRSTTAEHVATPVGLQLYRIAQEALNNALRHAQAQRISISLQKTAGSARLRVADNGVGLPAGSDRREGLGLGIMRYRAQLIGAAIHFTRPAAGGTAVIVEWPAPRGRRAHAVTRAGRPGRQARRK